MTSKETIRNFVRKIVPASQWDNSECIVERLNLYIKRLTLQIQCPNTHVLVPNDFVAHIVGEMNGFFNALSMTGMIFSTVNVTLKENEISFSLNDEIYLIVPSYL